MDSPLWIDRHRPALDALPQADVRTYLDRVAHGPINLLLHGPEGSGKTAAVYALAEELHTEPETDLQIINVADFFGMTKKEIANDPRFGRFIDASQRRKSKAAMINYVLKELAGYPPVAGDFKTILLDNAEAMREDFQQALRRVMERHFEATQFIIVTRQPGNVIQPIRSRCAQIPVRAPSTEEIVTVLERIVTKEDIQADSDGLTYIAEYAEGNLRQAIMAAQTTAVAHGEITMEGAYEALDAIGVDDQLLETLTAARDGDFSAARGTLDDLLVDEGIEGQTLLYDLLRVARTRWGEEEVTELYELAGIIDFDLVEGVNDRVQLGHFLSRLAPDVETVPKN